MFPKGDARPYCSAGGIFSLSKTLIIWLRRLSILMSLSVVLAVGYFYLTRSARHPENRTRQEPLKSDVTSATSEIEYLQTRDGVPFLSIKASRNVANIHGLNHLEDVKVTYYGENSRRTDSITADECLYSMTENQIQFKGNIKIYLADDYTIATSRLNYDKASDTAAGSGPFTFSARNLEGSGEGFSLNMKTRDLVVNKKVHFQYDIEKGKMDASLKPEKFLHLDAGRALIRESSRKIFLSDGVCLRSTKTRLDGREMDLGLTEARRLQDVTCRGNAGYRTKQGTHDITLTGETIRFKLSPQSTVLEEVSAEGEANLKFLQSTLEGSRIHIFATGTGGISRILSEGDVCFHTPEDDRTISGHKMKILFEDESVIREVVVTEKARFQQASEKSTYELNAESIQFQFRPSRAKTQLEKIFASGNSSLNMESKKKEVVMGRAHTLEIFYDSEGRFPQIGKGKGACHWTFTRPIPREDVVLKSDRFSVFFSPLSLNLRVFKADGNIFIRRSWAQKKWMETRSRTIHGTFFQTGKNKVSRLIQEGDVHLKNSQMEAVSERGEFSSNTFLLTGQPNVRSGNSITKASAFTYDITSDVVTGNGNVETVYSKESGKSQVSLLPWAGETKSVENIYIHSGKMVLENKTGLVRYTGNCRMVQGANTLTAKIFHWNRRSGMFSAFEDVFILYSYRNKEDREMPLEIRSEKMEYTPEKKKIFLVGRVRAKTPKGNMSSEQMWGFFEEGKGLQQLFAGGNVRIVQEDREAEGDEALFRMGKGDVILVGNPARVVDKKEGRTTQGVRLTLFGDSDRILIENSKKPLY